jgi:hypothetical protein
MYTYLYGQIWIGSNKQDPMVYSVRKKTIFIRTPLYSRDYFVSLIENRSNTISSETIEQYMRRRRRSGRKNEYYYYYRKR